MVIFYGSFKGVEGRENDLIKIKSHKYIKYGGTKLKQVQKVGER